MSERSLLAAQFFNTERAGLQQVDDGFLLVPLRDGDGVADHANRHLQAAGVEDFLIALQHRISSYAGSHQVPDGGEDDAIAGFRVRSVRSWIIASISVPK